MTREDINNIIQTLCPNDDDFEKPIISPAYLKTELEALALEQKPSGDAISRQAAFEAFGLSEATRKYGGDHSGYDTLMKYEIQDVLENLPPVTPEPQPCSNAIDRDEAIRVASGYCHFSNIAKELAKLPPVTPQATGHPQKYCDRNICVSNEYNGIGCDECEVTKSQEPKTDVLDKIKGYIDYIRNTGMGKNKSLEFIEKFIEGLKAESEEKE